MKTKEKVTEVQIIEPKQSTQEASSIENLMMIAVEKGLPVETMERLFALREKMKAEQAKEAFMQAMASFQAECPVIEKTKCVYEKDKVTVRYKWAPLDSIVTQTKEIIGRNGLSYSFTETKDEKNISVICKVTHRLGHSETSSFQLPIGTEAFMSDVQKHGARMTFGKRYAYCNAFGILTGDEDMDAKEEKEKPEFDEAYFKNLLNSSKNAQELSGAWAKVPIPMKPNLLEVKEFLKDQFSNFTQTKVAAEVDGFNEKSIQYPA